MTHAEIMAWVRARAEGLGLLVFHDPDSRRSWGPGFPDLVIAGRGVVLFAEVKGHDGVLSEHQREWGRKLEGGTSHQYAVITPAELYSEIGPSAIEKILWSMSRL